MVPFYVMLLELKTPKPKGLLFPQKTIGDHIRAKRLELALEQNDVAKQIGVSANTILNWELGHTSPPTHKGKRIIEFLGYNPKTVPKTLRERMLAFRWEKGLRTSDAARLIGVDPASWSSWERAKHSPSNQTLQKLKMGGINS